MNPPQGTPTMPISPVVPGYNPMGMSTQPNSLPNSLMGSQFGQAPPGYVPANSSANNIPAQPFNMFNPFNSSPQPTNPISSPQQSHVLPYSPYTAQPMSYSHYVDNPMSYSPGTAAQNPIASNKPQQPPPQYTQPTTTNPQFAPYSPQQNPQSSPITSPHHTVYHQQQQQPQQSPEDAARAKLTLKLQQKLRDFNENNAKIIEREMIESSNLEETNKLLDHSNSDVLADKQRQESAVMQLQKQIDDLNRWLEQNDKDEINVDEYTEPKDVLRKQYVWITQKKKKNLKLLTSF